jgi:hypothetical protein
MNWVPKMDHLLGYARRLLVSIFICNARGPSRRRSVLSECARPGLVSALALALVVLTAGCSGPGPAHPVVAPVPVPTPTSSAQLQLPLAAYELSNLQQSEADYLVFLLEKSCMARLGFEYLPGLSSAYEAQSTRTFDEFDSRLWGVSDAVVVREYGYHLPSWVEGTGKPETMGSLPPAAQLALTGRSVGGAQASGVGGSGIPRGGCAGQANQKVAAALGSAEGAVPPLVAQISLESFDRARSDPRVLAVFAKWSACMRAHGYDYANPFQPPAVANQSRPPTQAEIQTAVTDVGCKLKTNLLGVTYAVQSDYQNQLINQNAPQLAQIKAQVQQQAKALVSLAEKYGIAATGG